jgi:hypothetical protein
VARCITVTQKPLSLANFRIASSEMHRAISENLARRIDQALRIHDEQKPPTQKNSGNF